jgi:hypothetical protein
MTRSAPVITHGDSSVVWKVPATDPAGVATLRADYGILVTSDVPEPGSFGKTTGIFSPTAHSDSSGFREL